MSSDTHSAPVAPRPSNAKLAKDVAELKSQRSQVLSALNAQTPATEQPSIPEAYRTGSLQFTLPASTANAVGEVLATRQAFAEKGKLNLFNMPARLAPYPTKRFIPEPEGLFGRIKNGDNRDGREADDLWNVGFNNETALAALHKVAEQLKAGDTSSATDFLAIVHHHIQASYQRIRERIDFFSDSLESGKSEAILLPKYLREDDHPYQYDLYRDTKNKFAERRSAAFAKDLNKQEASSSFRNNHNNHNKTSSHPKPGSFPEKD